MNICFLSTEKKIDKQELMFLVSGSIGINNVIPNPASNWFPDKNWDELCCLDGLNAYRGISK